MSRVVEVVLFERVTREGIRSDLVRVDSGEDPSTAVHFGVAGDDSPPLPGDFAQLVETEGAGEENAVGYADQTEKAAQPGERRLYARNAAGAIVATVWLKGDGTVVVTNVSGKSLTMSPGGDIAVTGNLTVTGNIVANGQVSAMAATPATKVSLSTHLHPTAVGPSGAPTPGT